MLFQKFWWLIFPIMAFGLAGFRSWTQHRRYTATLDLLKTYATQGKELPSDIVKTLQQTADEDRGPARAWKRAITLNSLAIGLGACFYVLIRNGMGFGPAHPILAAAILFGALGLGSIVFALLQGKLGDK